MPGWDTTLIMSHSALRVRKSKRFMQNQTEVKADRISALPDSVLCHILSYLPTKNVVATSILARRWKLVWTSLQKLYFDDRQSRRLPGMMGDPMPRFEDFVERVLTGTQPTNITTFFMHCSRPVDLSSFHLWVCSAVRRNAREIELYLDQNHRVELPEELYVSPSVEVLKLMSDFLIKVPAGGTCFPNVKILTVQLESPENTLTEKLFCSCPSLEELSIQAYLNDEGPTTKFVISSSTLKRCTLWVATEGEMFTQAEYKVRITTPSLERLHIMSDIFGKFLVHDLNSLTDVILDIVYGEWSRVDPNRSIQLLQQLNNTTSLTVSYGMLCHLEVAVRAIGWAVLPVILSSSVHLQSLVLRKQSRFAVTEEQFGWIEGDIVPNCLLEHVKKIEITGVEGDEDELILVEYLLKYSSVLEVMVIFFKGSVSKLERRDIERSILQCERILGGVGENFLYMPSSLPDGDNIVEGVSVFSVHACVYGIVVAFYMKTIASCN
ncbi:putative FBD-associated F-box protein [Citrus sinensis]|uniref:FBD-associated F-box protein n=1 Tax=Citrus sinensis TaxID=2711 RepID=A0ACB8L8T8_CITSI|nr:putative FBD-associated F-box protein [Citrus sinensis]